MVSKYGNEFSVPQEFPSVLKAFTREILRSQPGNIYEFGAAYFSELCAQRDAMEAQEAAGTGGRPTPDQIVDMLNNLFLSADADGSGSLDVMEFGVLMKKAELGLPKNELIRLMAEADADGDGQIDYGEFVPMAVDLIQSLYAKLDAQAQADAEEERARVSAQQYMLHGMSRDALTAVISDVFKKADKDGSGDLNMAEFQVCLKDAELGLTKKEVSVLMHSVDMNMDGVVSYEEFAPLCFDILVEILKDELLQAQRTPTELEEYLVAKFSGADPGATGLLSTGAMRDVLQAAELGLTRLQIVAVVAEAPTDAEGGIDYTAFAPTAAELLHRMLDIEAMREREATYATIEYAMSQQQVAEQMYALCGELDPARSGIIEIGAFKAALETSALELKPKEVQALMACVDSEDGVTFAYVPLCEYAFRILEHLYREEAYHSRVQP
eukprot:Transcript_10700.p2 GENE.Transcript_10700~~Transcript_10700.p2  ORF type:complete len:440 (-),score=241.63 Transcript_10700:83-1402(-)